MSCSFCKEIREWRKMNNDAPFHTIYNAQLVMTAVVGNQRQGEMRGMKTKKGIRYCPECGANIIKSFRKWDAESKESTQEKKEVSA